VPPSADRQEVAVNSVQWLAPDDPADVPPDFNSVYQTHWRPMFRLALGLLRDAGLAEETVQDAFEALFARWDSLRNSSAAVGYLRVCVVNGSRSAVRRTVRARRRTVAVCEETSEGADAGPMLDAEHAIVREALASLPDMQREVLTLRYLNDLSDADIAAATGLSLGGVRSSSSRGLAALRHLMGALQ
jgi:RNA polymerase sigma-70 factor (sigma-E family)